MGGKGGGLLVTKRGKRTVLIAMAMIGSMVLVFLWEAPPSNVGYLSSTFNGESSVDNSEAAQIPGNEESVKEESVPKETENTVEEGRGAENETNVDEVDRKADASTLKPEASKDNVDETDVDGSPGNGAERERKSDRTIRSEKAVEKDTNEKIGEKRVETEVESDQSTRTEKERDAVSAEDSGDKKSEREAGHHVTTDDAIGGDTESLKTIETEAERDESAELEKPSEKVKRPAETAFEKKREIDTEVGESTTPLKKKSSAAASNEVSEKREVRLDGEPSEKRVIEEKTDPVQMEKSGEKRIVSAENVVADSDLEKKCDYSVGKWVVDKSRPFYSGFECKDWLSEGFSCRMNGKPDLSYENFRWQPSGCQLPEFNARAFLELLRNKVLAFIGDSLARQELQSLMCMLTRGKNDTLITNVESDFGFFTPPGARKSTGFAQRFEETNTTIVFIWTSNLGRLQTLNETDPLSRVALHLDRPDQFVEDHLHQLDIVMLNSGHHWNGGKIKLNRMDFYVNGEHVGKGIEDPLYFVPNAYNHTVHEVVKWFSKKIEGSNKLVYYRSLSPRHFRNGDWDTGGTCDSTVLSNSTGVVEVGDPIDTVAESAVRGTNVKLFNITSLSLLRGEAHVSKYTGRFGGQDCLHWCLPGVPDTWNEILFAELSLSLITKRVANSSVDE